MQKDAGFCHTLRLHDRSSSDQTSVVRQFLTQHGESLVGRQRSARLRAGRVRRLHRLGFLGGRGNGGVGFRHLDDLSLVGPPTDLHCGVLVLLGLVLSLEASEPFIRFGVEALGIFVAAVLAVFRDRAVKRSVGVL